MRYSTFSTLLFLSITAFASAQGEAASAVYAVVPKFTTGPFFDEVRRGCTAAAAAASAAQSNVNATCQFIGTQELDAQGQADIIDALIGNDEGNASSIAGLAVSVIDLDITGAAIDRAMEAGIPTITFDSDAPNSQRLAHVGTNNFEFGHSFAWLLATHGGGSGRDDGGGNYAIISSQGPNLDERVDGIRYKLEETFDSQWEEIQPPTDCQDSPDVALEQMYELAASNPELDAIVSVGGWPMWVEPSSRWKEFVDANRHLLLFVADASPEQIALLNEGYVDALVGQKPFEMGELAIQTLVEYNNNDTAGIETVISTGERVYLSSSESGGDGAETSAAFNGHTFLSWVVLPFLLLLSS